MQRSHVVNAEILKLNSFLDIDVYTSDLRAITNGIEPLQCSSGDLIEYFKGGDGTVFTNGQWTVPANPNNPDISMPFELDYKLNEALGCVAIADPSTPAWEGSLNIGNGNGVFNKNIYTGIPGGTSTFSLDCSVNVNNYNLKGAVFKNDLELVQMYEQIIGSGS